MFIVQMAFSKSPSNAEDALKKERNNMLALKGMSARHFQKKILF